MQIIFTIIFTLLTLFNGHSALAEQRLGGTTTIYPYQGGTGVTTTAIGNIGKCLSVSAVAPFTYTLASCGGVADDWNTFASSFGQNALTTSSSYPVLIRGNLAVSNTLYANGPIIVSSSPTFTMQNSLASFIGNVNNYAQIGIQNLSSGSGASSDWLIHSDLSNSDATYLLDIGIQNSNTNSGLLEKLDSYIISSDSALNIGTNSSTNNKAVLKFFTGGFNNSKERLRIDTSGNFIFASSSGNNFGKFSIDTSGNVSASGTLQSYGLSTFLSGFISSASSTIGATLSISGAATVSSTLSVLNLETQIGGFQSNASSSIGSILSITGATTVSSTLAVSGLTSLAGFLSSASSSIASSLNVVGNVNISSTLFVGSNENIFGISSSSLGYSTSGTYAGFDGYTARTMLKKVGIGIAQVSTTADFISTVGSFDRAVTIRQVTAINDCPWGCVTKTNNNAGVTFQLYHGADRSASTTATLLVTAGFNNNSSTTLQSYCPSGTFSSACTRAVTWNDNTLAAGETLWIVPQAASTSPINLSLDVYYSED